MHAVPYGKVQMKIHKMAFILDAPNNQLISLVPSTLSDVFQQSMTIRDGTRITTT